MSSRGLNVVAGFGLSGSGNSKIRSGAMYTDAQTVVSVCGNGLKFTNVEKGGSKFVWGTGRFFFFPKLMGSGKTSNASKIPHTRIQIDGEPGGVGGDEWRRHEYGG